ncbi:hypothetical protein GH714_039088 [Hevea brasiliensis]|uniref:Germin-like protein n=1 Tax=Hevea brasiliensis TaxID=3981 RepID=A0A6A6KPE3_HEVBR|nr:hypothetical protein GH714_039088 [Hevea brasiliensis]
MGGVCQWEVLQEPKPYCSEDFFFPGLNVPGNTGNRVGSNVTLVNVDKLFGLNTLGISLARLDFAPNGGLNPPHTHPRATEILVVVEGTLYVGFVTSNPNRLFTKILYPGDVFVFPIGLIHFQFNIAKTNAVAFAGLSSQNPGVITIANAIFGPNPPINPDVLAKAFQLDNDEVFNIAKTNGVAIVSLNSQNPGFITIANATFGSYNPPINPDVLAKAFQVDKKVVKNLQTNGVAIASLNSQNPGVITEANATFGSNPPINPDVLAKAFQLGKKVVKDLQVKFGV